MKPEESGPDCGALKLDAQLSRRKFLFGAGTALVWVSLPGCDLSGGRTRAMAADYPHRVIGKLGELEVGAARPFFYPVQDPSAMGFLIRLGQPAGGGVGPDRDVVAFNSFCTHQGGPLAGLFRADPPVAGPCPLHWTTFDLTRHGMVVSGHATLGLPQIVLETRGDDIVATGVLGLLFGYSDNRRLVRESQEI